MGRSVLACLVLAQILLFQAVAIRSGPEKVLVRTGSVVGHSISDPPSSSTESSWEGETESTVAEPPEIVRLEKRHSPDRSVAGGGVIIGGLVTAIFAAVYCYIRVTRKRDDEKN